MANIISYLAETKGLLHGEQMGGQHGRSAVDTAKALVHDIQQANCNGKVLSALFVDVKGAFDHLSRTQQLLIIHSLGFPTPVLNWTDSFLSERYLGFAFDGRYLRMSLVFGV